LICSKPRSRTAFGWALKARIARGIRDFAFTLRDECALWK
jgi:hypothetical protein